MAKFIRITTKNQKEIIERINEYIKEKKVIQLNTSKDYFGNYAVEILTE